MMTQLGLCKIVSKDFWQILKVQEIIWSAEFSTLQINTLFYKEMRMRYVYIELLLKYILFVSLTFVTCYGDQSIETVCLAGIFSPGSWVGFFYFRRCNFWAEYSIVLLCCLWISTWSLIFSLKLLIATFFGVCIYVYIYIYIFFLGLSDFNIYSF